MASDEYEAYFAAIRAVPPGFVTTYGDVAKTAGRPRWARRVGYALSSCADAGVPWWRVVNARGEISRGGGRAPESADLQRDLLESEGVHIDLEGRIDLTAHRYGPAPTKGRRGPRKAPSG